MTKAMVINPEVNCVQNLNQTDKIISVGDLVYIQDFPITLKRGTVLFGPASNLIIYLGSEIIKNDKIVIPIEYDPDDYIYEFREGEYRCLHKGEYIEIQHGFYILADYDSIILPSGSYIYIPKIGIVQLKNELSCSICTMKLRDIQNIPNEIVGNISDMYDDM